MKLSSADIAFSHCIRAAADNTCLRCKKQFERTECSHVFGRRHRTIRWAKDNAKCLCHACHRWWHENPADSGRWFLLEVGKHFLDLLREKRDSRVKVPKSEEKEIAKHYREQLKQIEDKRLDGQTGYVDFQSYQ